MGGEGNNLYPSFSFTLDDTASIIHNHLIVLISNLGEHVEGCSSSQSYFSVGCEETLTMDKWVDGVALMQLRPTLSHVISSSMSESSSFPW